LKPFLRFRASRPGHFNALRTGDASPLPVPLDFARGQGVPHSERARNDGGLSAVTHKRPQSPPVYITAGSKFIIFGFVLRLDSQALEKGAIPSRLTVSLWEAKVWDSSKGRIFRIKIPLPRVAARFVVCIATGQWNHILWLKQTAGRAACTVGADTDWRRVLFRAVRWVGLYSQVNI
jgi:hypothetical protein